MISQDNLNQAWDALQQQAVLPEYFAKLAAFGVNPATAADAQRLMATGDVVARGVHQFITTREAKRASAGMAAVDALLPTQPAATWSQATKAAADHAGNQTVRDAVAILLAASRQQAA